MTDVITCVANFLGIEESDLDESADLQMDLGLSSFDLMALSCELEEHFHTKIDAEKLTGVRTILDLKAVTAQALAV